MSEKVLVNKGVAIYKIISDIDQESAKKFVNTINLNYIIMRNLEIEALVFSLKAVKKCSGTGLNVLYEKLSKLEKDLKIKVGFVDYSDDVFKILKSVVKGSRVGLFDKTEVLHLFMDKLHLKKGDTVLIFEDEKIEKEKLLAEIISMGYFTIAPNSLDDYNKKLAQKSSYVVAMRNIYYPYYGESSKESLGTEKIKEANLDGVKKLTKNLIQELSIFVNSTIETFESMINIKATKVDSKILIFDIEDNSLMASYINFDGKIDGIIVLLFPKEFAKKAYEALFFEESEDENELKDAMKEFANIIGGRAKALLEEKNIHVNISLPKSYSSLAEIKPSIDKKQGVKVTFTLDNLPLYFFLTR